ncbi:MAG: hypothetical protein QM683_01665 [Lacrimispora sp.]
MKMIDDAVIRLLDKKTDKDNMQYHAIAITAQAAMKEHVLKAMKVFSMKSEISEALPYY